jgi:hypothetical protein
MEFGEGADRAPRKEEVGHYSSPLVLRENRHSRPIQPSRFPAEPLLTPDPPCCANSPSIVAVGRDHSAQTPIASP